MKDRTGVNKKVFSYELEVISGKEGKKNNNKIK
jgi:hypothetical protein